MDQMATENCSILSAKEPLLDFGRNDLRAGVLPSNLLPEIYRGKSGKVFYPEYTREAKALHRALDRLSGWELPGKEHVKEYIRSMYRRNFRPKTYASNLVAIYIFLTFQMVIAVPGSMSTFGSAGLSSLSGTGDFDPKNKHQVLKDAHGLKSARATAESMIEPARIIKKGREDGVLIINFRNVFLQYSPHDGTQPAGLR